MTDLPATMQAAVLTAHGGPECLRVDDRYPRPEPGPGEVLVRIGAAGMNNTDIWSREGAYSADPDRPAGWLRVPLEFPRIQGGDAAGEVVAVGDGVSKQRIGERVLVNSQLYGDGLLDAELLGSERDGAFAEFVAVPAENAHRIETSLSDVELATIPIAYLTALHMLNRARVEAGERLVVTGASGGVGTALVELARVRGAEVVALTSAAKREYVEGLGAVAVDRESADLADKLREALGGGADVVADVVGGPLFPVLLDVLDNGGRYVTSGAIAGPEVTLDLRTLYLKHLEAIGSTMGTQEEFAELVSLIEQGRLSARLGGTWPLSKIHEAQEAFVEKRFTGKLVLVPDAVFEESQPSV